MDPRGTPHLTVVFFSRIMFKKDKLFSVLQLALKLSQMIPSDTVIS